MIKSSFALLSKSVADIKQKGSFVQNVSYNSLGYIVLFGSQLLFTPIISRIYSPAAYGFFSTIFALATNLATVATLKMDNLIYIEKDVSKRDFIVKFVCGSSFYISLLVLIVCCLLYSSQFITSGFFKDLHFLFLPLLMFLQVLFIFNGAEVTNAKAFKKAFFVSVPSNLGSKIYTLIFGYLTRGNVVGLLSSEALIRIAYITLQLKYILHKKFSDYFYIRKSDFAKGIQLIKEYKRFPVYELPVTYFNVVTSQIHIYVLAFLNQKTLIGWLGMAFTIMDAPTRLLGYSIQPVLIQKCSELIYDREKLTHALNTVLFYFSLVAMIPFIIILFFGPTLFSWALGANWLMAGKLASAFSIFYLFKMEFELLDGILSIMQLQRFKFFVFLMNNILRIVSIVILVLIFKNTFLAIIYWSIFNAAFMLLSLIIIYKKIGLHYLSLLPAKLLLMIVAAIEVFMK